MNGKAVAAWKSIACISFALLCFALGCFATDEQLAALPVHRTDEIVVPADKTHVESQFLVEKGGLYRIEAVGRWKGSDGMLCGPEGNLLERFKSLIAPTGGWDQDRSSKEAHGRFYYEDLPRNSLVAQFGNEKWSFYVGKSCNFCCPITGKLTFKINDPNYPSNTREGMIRVSLRRLDEALLETGGRDFEVKAQIDQTDYLHIAKIGIWWEYGGAYARVGDNPPHCPTVVNGIYWWPTWITDKETDVFPIHGLFPKDNRKFYIRKVDARKDSECTIYRANSDEYIVKYYDPGWGSSTISAVFGWR